MFIALIAVVAAVALPLGLLATFVLFPILLPLQASRSLPVEEGRAKLSTLLSRYFGLKLREGDRVVAAYEESDGVHGDGTLWFHVQMKPRTAIPFAEALVRRAGSNPRTSSVKAVAASARDGWENRPKWWDPAARPDVMAYEIVLHDNLFIAASDDASEFFLCRLNE
ncbi:hypothetical protein [Paludisphaera soli]|uniref:hypothetical protein n=1 Tax=Paludisphaera soli TaxID=2712865 RepID=UPI0013EB754A|nr:hypothetical protein [Paludisphaera soli]